MGSVSTDVTNQRLRKGLKNVSSCNYPLGVYNATENHTPRGYIESTMKDIPMAEEEQDREANLSCQRRHKATPRTSDMQADLQKRLNRVIGQLNGVKAMIDDNRYCGDVLTQLSAAESAIHSISGIVMQNHLETCVVEQIQEGNTEVIDEVMRLMKRFARS